MPSNVKRWLEPTSLAVVMLLFAVLSCAGITWGLPSRNIDRFLFGNEPPWTGDKIHRLAEAGKKFGGTSGADVDVDPLDKTGKDPILLTGTDADVARIYLRYRLYTYQPDEMITMMALAGMRPRRLQLDPKLYQYGGLFIYPVGALIKLCGWVGLINVRSDVTYYLDHPDEFGKFYIVARAYAAAWGMIGLLAVFAITRRLAGGMANPRHAARAAALGFVLMPVVICMAHEGKPHLPGAVLMLLAVLFAMNTTGVTDGGRASEGRWNACRTAWWLMCMCCGASVGMVLSSWPIFVLIPLVAWTSCRQSNDHCSTANRDGSRDAGPDVQEDRSGVGRYAIVAKTLIGALVAIAVYTVANPYVLINALIDRATLRSNFGNSFAMYEISRVGEGILRVLDLTVEGATLPIVVLGASALVLGLWNRNRSMAPLALPAALFFLQFALIGAGKPAEYGRFGIFTNAALVVGAACLIARTWHHRRIAVRVLPTTVVVIWLCVRGGAYITGFQGDASTATSTRVAAGESIDDGSDLATLAEPAPYCYPPVHFAGVRLFLYAGPDQIAAADPKPALAAIVDGDQIRRWHRERGWNGHVTYVSPFPPSARTVDAGRFSVRGTPISWAGKPVFAAWSDR